MSLIRSGHFNSQKWTAIVLLFVGAIFTIVSLTNLGKSTSLGIPNENTELKTRGVYKISRNPMYMGFNLFSLSAILFTGNIIVVIFGIYSILVYHLIILGEEEFLEERFTKKYLEYKNKVRRYV